MILKLLVLSQYQHVQDRQRWTHHLPLSHTLACLSPTTIKLRSCPAQVGPCWRSKQFLQYSAIYVQLLLSFLLDRNRWPVTANATTVILMEKGINATLCQFAAVQLPEVYCKRCGAVLFLKLIGLPIAGHFYIQCHPCAAPVSLVSRYINDSQQRGIGFVLANHYM